MTLLHGIDVEFGAVAPSPPAESPTVIGVVGTGTAGSPLADTEVPTAVHNMDAAETQFGTEGSIFSACQAIFAQASVWVVGVRYDHTLSGIPSGSAFPTNPAPQDGDRFRFSAAATGLSNARDDDGTTITTAAIGDVFRFNGTNWIKQDGPSDTSTSITNCINALRNAETITGHKPTLLIAPGLTYDALNDGSANTNVAHLASVAESLKAYVIADTANSTIAVAKAWSTANGGNRVLPFPQQVVIPESSPDSIPMSGYMAGAIARNDGLHGVRDSISNRNLTHIVSVSPVYSFSYEDPATEAADLDSANLSVVVRSEGAWLAWGGTTKYTPATDPRADVNIGRIFDGITTRAVRIARHMLGRGIRNDFVNRLVSNVQDYLDTLVTNGDLTSAVVEPDVVRNTDANIRRGRVYLKVTARPTPNAKLITLTINTG